VDNGKFQELVLKQLELLTEGQQRLDDKLEQGQQRLDLKVDGLEQGQKRLELKMDKLELRVENEVIDKIRALFDDREMQNKRIEFHDRRLDSIDEKLDRISNDTAYLVSEVISLKRLVK
jgi:phage gp16-like protein